MVADLGSEQNYDDENTDDVLLESASGFPLELSTAEGPHAGSGVGSQASGGPDGHSGTAQQTASSSLWLVKSGERILGPFLTEEVIEKVRARELVVIDEIAAPASRWRYLRDEPSFALVVEESRRAQLAAREDTEVQMAGAEGFSGTSPGHAGGGAVSGSDSVTVTPTHRMHGNQLETHVGVSPHDSSQAIQDAEFTDEVIRPGSATKPEENITGRAFGVTQATVTATSLERRSRLIWLFTLLVVVGVGAFLIKENPPARTAIVDNTEAFKQSLSEGENAWNHGDLEKALVAYRHADELLPANPDVTVRMAPLMMKLEGQTAEAKRGLEDLLTHTADAKLRREAQLGLGLAALYGDNLSEAQKQFQALLTADPNDIAVHFNMGVSHYLAGDFKSAASDLVETLRLSPDSAPATLLLALSYLNEGGDNLKRASEVLDAYLTSHFDYRQEAQVLQTYITLERGNKMQALASAGMTLETDPYLTTEHLHDPWLDLDPLSAAKILTYVEKIQSGLNSPTTQALQAIFEVKAKQTGEAEKTVADGLAAKPSNADLLAANAFALMQTGRESDAKATLSIARKDGSKLAWILTGRNCQSLHEAQCEAEAWAKLTAFDPPVLIALVGQAEGLLASNQKPAAEKDLAQAESLSPQYLPTIRFREQVSGK